MTTLTIPTTPAALSAQRGSSDPAASARRRELRFAAAVQAAWLRGVQGAR